ncbi:MAG: pyridoxamine 5'-phosphate oxidase family protein [Chloroflexaceae bacterium]|jgi:hypothetical protein|nr:pyridoxamine 5'-phosphate oxidase family protein [Chloroflexaceae bacterium]
MSWHKLESAEPELAAFGAARFGRTGVAYLATVRSDGQAQVYPVTPIIGAGRLFLFVEPTSPEGNDLQQNGSYAMHSAAEATGGSGGDFFIAGSAQLVQDPALRQIAAHAASYTPAEHGILFELTLDRAIVAIFDGVNLVHRHWRAG